ncbi:MAG: ATP-binding protein [Desulfitobacteriaceae bacterium]|nr:ATP-binding protein [Desulfitobacteriaceae bacterium]MDD4751739.1 ATP-binding protein [Desulfitobacteriaceae bacterium]
MYLADLLNYNWNARGEKTMRIQKISVGGFRNIDNTLLEMKNMIALVSLNNYGKSNLLKAIDFGVRFIKNNTEIKSAMMSWPDGIPLTIATASKNYMIEFEMQTEINTKTYNVVYGYEFKWIRDDETGARIIGEWLKVKLDEKGQKYNSYINRNEENAFYKTSETGRCSNKISAEPNELLINKLKAFDNLYYNSIIKRVNNLSAHIDRHLDASSFYRPDPIIRKDIKVSELENSENLPRAMYHLKSKSPDKYELLINSFKQLFPHISEINVEEISLQGRETRIPEDIPFTVAKEIYVINVTDENLNQSINFEMMSDGAKRVFLLLASIILAENKGTSLIAIEEPENSIHPSLLQSYLRVISQLLSYCKIVITSHSPYILQYLEPTSIYIGLPNSKGVAKFSRVRGTMQKSLQNEANSSDTTLGDYVFQLLSGTGDDIKELNRFLENSDE